MQDSLEFKSKLFRRDKGDHFMLIKETIHQEEIAIINTGTSNFIKQTILD
jgi:hypothetical protein